MLLDNYFLLCIPACILNPLDNITHFCTVGPEARGERLEGTTGRGNQGEGGAKQRKAWLQREERLIATSQEERL